MSGRIVHFELPYDDADRARAFYREVFDWNVTPMPELSYTIVSTGPSGDQGPTEPGYINGGMAERGGPITAPVVTVDVDDISSALASVTAHGGSTVQDRMEVGEMGWAAYFRDPEGNVVGLWQTRRG
jgi:predicted enzyme related to lactoylglutathione lyase